MLKQVDIERKPNGLPVSVPAVLSDATLDQHVKRFIEVADGDPGDRHGLIALFRKYHGGAQALRILERILRELHNPQIALTLRQDRGALLLFFAREYAWHPVDADVDFGYPGDPADLPI